MVVLALASIARAGTVCAKNAVQASCDYDNLAEALASTDPTLELQPGIHVGGVTVDRRVDITCVRGAILRSQESYQPVFTVAPGGTGSTFQGLVYDPFRGSDGPLVEVRGAEVTVVDADVRFAYSNDTAPGFHVAQGGALYLYDPQIRDNRTQGDGVIRVEGATLEVIGGRFARNYADRGSAIVASGDSTVTLRGTTLEQGDTATGEGNSLWMQGGTLVLDGVTVVANGFPSFGFEVYLDRLASVTLTGGTFDGPPGAAVSGALWAVGVGTVEIVDTRFTAWNAGAVVVDEADTVTVRDAVFDRNESGEAGGAMSVSTTDLLIDRSWFCDNAAISGGALDIGCSGSCQLTHSVLQGNVAVDGGGALSTTAVLSVEHSTLLANGAASAAAVDGTEPLAMETSIVMDHRGSGGALSYPDPEVFRTNALNGNLDDDATFSFSRQTNQVDPRPKFVDGPGRCGISVTLTDGPVNDWLWDNDVGAINDHDQDGATSDLDCDDDRPDVFPGADEIPGDGIDQDCDGKERCPLDRDGDGFAGDQFAPGPVDCPLIAGDCNDDAPDVNPGAVEIWYDQTDQDCAGNDDFDSDGDGVPRDADCDDQLASLGLCRVRVGGGCETAPASGWSALAAALGLLSRRRSR